MLAAALRSGLRPAARGVDGAGAQGNDAVPLGACVVPLAALAPQAHCDDDDDKDKNKEHPTYGRAFREMFYQAKDTAKTISLPGSQEEVQQSASETIDYLIRTNAPAKIGMGFVAGFCSAFAVKRIVWHARHHLPDRRLRGLDQGGL
eukprot:CAMPEP_0118856584 /NCGR_PEP_ID=MMETSP1163-20130328/3994_1 /TAXON_ID=124430 /ORGANISM="Phaeomonas parva, Strain CCMP2877" /LENGTH=146 /DNA_ID=CAMNT_0006789711 /DNA_START=469 /DNA_END=906 /DNA_ORIENTATION=+